MSVFELTQGRDPCDIWNPHHYLREAEITYLADVALPRQLEYECSVQETPNLSIATYRCSERMCQRIHRVLAELQQTRELIVLLKGNE